MNKVALKLGRYGVLLGVLWLGSSSTLWNTCEVPLGAVLEKLDDDYTGVLGGEQYLAQAVTAIECGPHCVVVTGGQISNVVDVNPNFSYVLSGTSLTKATNPYSLNKDINALTSFECDGKCYVVSGGSDGTSGIDMDSWIVL